MPGKKLPALIITAFLLCVTASLAVEDDGFGAAKQIKAKHFVIYYAPQLDPADLAQKLNIRPADEILAGKNSQQQDFPPSGLSDMVDTLFLRVCGILDMNLYSFEGSLKICRDTAQLRQIYRGLFDKDLQNKSSFYVYDFNAVYISADDFRIGVLSHEIAHAVISRYFVVLPSVRIQEVLASYVEFQLRKSGQ